jgi:predicted transcriptional regulator
MREVKRNLELDIVNSIKKGLNPAKIAVQLNLSLPNLSYYLSSLKSKGIIERVGYGVWQVIPSGEVKINTYHTNSKDIKEIRGHAFIWKVKPKGTFNWLDILNNKKVPYETKGLQKTPRIIVNGKKIWLGQTNIIIYDKNSHFAINSIESKKLGIWELQELVIVIEKVLGIDLRGYKFTSRREHYSLIINH